MEDESFIVHIIFQTEDFQGGCLVKPRQDDPTETGKTSPLVCDS